MKNSIEKILKEHSDLTDKTNEKIESVIDSYRNNTFAQRMINQELASMIKEEVDKIVKEHEENEQKLQVTFEEIINKEKDRIIHMNENTTAEYSIRINNALNFLKASDDSLTDDDAHMMLEDFEKDYRTMCLFKQIIENINGLCVINPADPTDIKFPKTFENFSNKLKCFDILDELTKNSKDALTWYLRDKNYVLKDGDASKGIGRLTWDFSVPSPGYASLTGNDNIVELLQKYETIEI